MTYTTQELTMQEPAIPAQESLPPGAHLLCVTLRLAPPVPAGAAARDSMHPGLWGKMQVRCESIQYRADRRLYEGAMA